MLGIPIFVSVRRNEPTKPIPRGPRPNVHQGNFTYKSLYKGKTIKGNYTTCVSLTPPFKLKVDQPH
jgi:hypothetical protein